MFFLKNDTNLCRYDKTKTNKVYYFLHKMFFLKNGTYLCRSLVAFIWRINSKPRTVCSKELDRV